VGRHNSRYTSYGHTALVDPWGTLTLTAPDRPGLFLGEVDLDDLEEVRNRIPLRGEG
jgi:predicted amidohydrolase